MLWKNTEQVQGTRSAREEEQLQFKIQSRVVSGLDEPKEYMVETVVEKGDSVTGRRGPEVGAGLLL